MIKYNLICACAHEFTAWFASSVAFDEQQAAGDVLCPLCGDGPVEKAIMAPMLGRHNKSRDDIAEKDKAGDESRAEKIEQMAQMMQQAHEHIVQNYDYVGDGFADEARAIYYGECAPRDIYGESTLAEVNELIDEGVPIAPLPKSGLIPDKRKQ